MTPCAKNSLIPWTLLLAIALLVAPAAAKAGAYPSNKCAGAQLKAGAKKCKAVLGAWSVWLKKQDDTKRDGKLDKAETKFSDGMTKAEDKATKKGVTCALTQELDLIHQTFSSDLDTAMAEIVADIQAGLNLGLKDEQKCGASLLKLAANECSGYLKAESKLVGNPAKDSDGAKRAAAQAKAKGKFDSKWDATCPSDATMGGIQGKIDDLVAAASFNTTVAPDVSDDAFMAIIHPAPGEEGHEVEYQKDVLEPRCQDNSQYGFAVKRGSENKLLINYIGGGACWDTLTCGANQCTQNVDPNALSGGTSFGSGLNDLSNPENPFTDWNVIVVPYCTCDVHWGDSVVIYPTDGFFPDKTVHHVGYHTTKLVEKWAREHFVNPSDIFITGGSAGAYGATLAGVHMHDVYPASSISVLADAGNGIITNEFLTDNFDNWGVRLPDVPGISDVPILDQSVPSIFEAAADFYPNTNWAHLTTAYDGGGGGQTEFYNIMLNPDDQLLWFDWWLSSCLWNETMVTQANDTFAAVSAANDNYRYYIGSGSRHEGLRRSKVYADTTGGVPPLVDWVSAMIADDPNWVNVAASPSNVLLPGDPRPGPLTSPFELSDPNDPNSPVVINCP